ncbi:MAG: undecaprenyl diphosphate synthase family protein [Methanosarcinales archaeon Met12]|nr:MAG: undecaprenyl diphosphate synthase family protein [Methanosarcinales archaeon Met12]
MDGVILDQYEKRVIGQIGKEGIPEHIILVIAEEDLQTDDALKKLKAFVFWCSEIGIRRVTVHISVIAIGEIKKRIYSTLTKQLIEAMSHIPAKVAIYTESERIDVTSGKYDLMLDISIGYGGKQELVRAIKQIMHKVEVGEFTLDDIDEALVESHLVFKAEPDLVIKTGGVRLTDFLIWQAVYSEFFFTDVNWSGFRKVDFLRAIRDYQKRQRRFGK